MHDRFALPVACGRWKGLITGGKPTENRAGLCVRCARVGGRMGPNVQRCAADKHRAIGKQCAHGHGWVLPECTDSLSLGSTTCSGSLIAVPLRSFLSNTVEDSTLSDQ